MNKTEHLITWIYVLIGEKQFQKLPEDLQKVILDAGKEMQAYEHKLFLEDEQKLVTELQDLGMTFIEPDKAAFAEKGKPGLMETLTPEQKELFERIVNTK